MTGRPTGTVTFLFTDVEDSTRLWAAAPHAMRVALRRHDEIVRGVLQDEGGHVFSVAGDSFGAAFQDHRRALTAARRIQAALAEEPWPDGAAVRVRIGLHLGAADEERDDNYYGTVVNTAARVMATAAGGQVVLSGALGALVEDDAWPLGARLLAGLPEPIPLWLLQPDGATGTAPPVGAPEGAARPSNPSVLVGRDVDIDRVEALLRQHRLVTIAGPGGVGKTTLALAVARGSRLTEQGVRVVTLAAATPERVAAVVAAAVGAVERPGSTMVDSVVSYLARRDVLVVLDNAEHVLGVVRPLVAELLGACPGVRLLVTSREPTGVASEHVVRLEGLSPQGPDAPAVSLFYERAAAAGRELPRDAGTRAKVADLCAQLDGLPLAIELAAARTRTFGIDDLADRLHLVSAPAGAARDPGDRQRTMDTTIAWSYELLEPAEQLLLHRLAVFADGFEFAAAEDVCAGGPVAATDVVEVLDRLVAKSLVVHRGGDDRTRLRLLEPVRRFASRRLAVSGELASVRRRHRAHFVSAVERAFDEVDVRGDARLLRLLDADRANLLEAAEGAREDGDVDAAIRIVLSAPIGLFQLRFDFHDLADRLVDVPGVAAHPRYLELLSMAAGGAFQRGRIDRVARIAAAVADETAVGRTDPHAVLGDAMARLLVGGDVEGAIAVLDRLDTSRHWIRCMSDFVGGTAYRIRDFADGQRRMAEGAAWAHRAGAQAYEAMILEQMAQGEVLYRPGNPEAGALMAQEAARLAAVTGLVFVEQQALLQLVRADLRLGRRGPEAWRALRRALDVAVDAGVVPNQWFVLRTVAAALAKEGHTFEAALIEACGALDPFAPQADELLDDAFRVVVPAEDRERAAALAPTIADSAQLSRRVLALLDTIEKQA